MTQRVARRKSLGWQIAAVIVVGLLTAAGLTELVADYNPGNGWPRQPSIPPRFDVPYEPSLLVCDFQGTAAHREETHSGWPACSRVHHVFLVEPPEEMSPRKQAWIEVNKRVIHLTYVRPGIYMSPDDRDSNIHPIYPAVAWNELGAAGVDICKVTTIAWRGWLFDFGVFFSPFGVVIMCLVVRRRWIARRSRARVRRGRCRVCAYDLTGNVSGICPECGTEIPGHHPARAR
jgi:hypothetical protein